MSNNIKDFLEEQYPDESIVTYDGFDDAFIGVVYGFDNIPKACYDYKKCISILVEESDKDDEDPYTSAIEHFNYNTLGTYAGRSTPVFLNKLDSE